MATRPEALRNRGCGADGRKASSPQPAAIVYLDQCALSNIAKSKDAFWRQTHQRLTSLVARGTVVCPVSPLHREESLLTGNAALREALQALYQQLAAGSEFCRPAEIELAELSEALRCFLGSQEPGAPMNAWQDFSASGLSRFQQEVVQKIEGCSRSLGEATSVLSTTDRDTPERSVLPEPPAIAWLADRLVREVRRLQPPEADPVAVVQAFLRSSDLRQVPFLVIACTVETALLQQAHAEKSRRPPRPSDRSDVTMLSHYAPYCDAVFLDNEFRKLASQRNIDLPRRCQVRLFSESNREAFSRYLTDVASGSDH
jgi:hypothetical protein